MATTEFVHRSTFFKPRKGTCQLLWQTVILDEDHIRYPRAPLLEKERDANRLAQLEQAFLNDLDRVDRGIMTEAEYLKRQEVRRHEQEGLQSRKATLEASVAARRDREAQAKAVPVRVSSFLEDFQGMDVVKAKAILQTIIKAAHVWKDGRIELEFR